MRRIALVGLAILLTTVAVAAAAGDGAKVKIKITGGGYDGETAHAEGTLRSSKPACIDDRKLELYIVKGNGREARFAKVRSDAAGEWTGEGPIGNGRRKGLMAIAPESDPPGPGKCAAGSERFIFPDFPFPRAR